MANPATERAQSIVAEARQRLAAQNGKASMLPQMIKKIQSEYEMEDRAPINMRNQIETGNPPRMPTNMDAYINKVLQMSGMMGDGQKANVPTPTPRPSMPGMDDDDEPGASVGATSPDGVADASEIDPSPGGVAEGTPEDGIGFADMLMLGGGGAGAYAIYKYLSKRFGSKAKSGVEQMINKTMDDYNASLDKQKSIAGPRASNVDETIKQIEGPEEQKLLTGPEPDPARFGDPKALEAPEPQKLLTGPAQNTDAIIEQAMKMPASKALQFLEENGIAIDDSLFDALAQRIQESPNNAGRGAAKRALRGAM